MKFISKNIPLFLFSLILSCMWVGIVYAANNDATLESPTSFKTIPQFLEAALRALVQVAIPIVTLFYVIAGFQFLAAQGNASKLEKAKLNLLYVTIGAIFILGAWLISVLIAGTVSQLVSG